MQRNRIIITGAAGRDFHNFNTRYKDNDIDDVVAFTATQIPDIEERVFPAELAGKLFTNGIPISHESDLEELIKKYSVNEVIFTYSDVSYNYVQNIF